MSFGSTLSEGYSSLLLDRLVTWFVGTGEFHNIMSEKLEGLQAKDFKRMSVSPTVVGEWFLDLGLKAPTEKFTDPVRQPNGTSLVYWVLDKTIPVTLNQTVQVWFLEELYKCFWRTELAEHLLDKEEEEKILKKKHLTAIGNAVFATEWWQAHELAIKRQVKNLKATEKVLEA